MSSNHAPRRYRRILPVLALAGALAACDDVTAHPTESTEPKPVEVKLETASPVVVTVNGRAITRAEIDEAADAMLGAAVQGMPPEKREALRARFAPRLEEQLIAEALLTAAAQDEGLSASAEEIEAELERLAARLAPGQKLEEVLAAQGLGREKLRIVIGKNLAIEKLAEHATKDLAEPTQETVQAFYDEHPDEFEKPASAEARHILITFDRDADEAGRKAARAKAEEVRAKLLEAGADGFAELAKEHSACPSKDDGGKLGRFARGRMVPAFENAAFEQEIGVIGSLVETPHGYHIIQVTAREEASRVALEEVREPVARYLHDKARQEAMVGYIESLRAKATIVRADVPEKTADGEKPASTAWLTDWDEAKARSKASGKPILANFSGSDWCGYCQKLTAEVFDTKTFAAWASDQVVLVELDFPSGPQPDALRLQNESLRERYGVQGFPTILFLDSEGEVLGRAGYTPGGAQAWIEGAKAALARA